jgi:hypothetical protein
MDNRFEKLAEYLADRYVAIHGVKEAGVWDNTRPENKEHPGANWWTGLGTGLAAGSAEAGIGKHGLRAALNGLLASRDETGRHPAFEFFETNPNYLDKTHSSYLGDNAVSELSRLKKQSRLERIISHLENKIEGSNSWGFSRLPKDAVPGLKNTAKLQARLDHLKKLISPSGRLGSAGIAGSAATLFGAYTLPALLDTLKSK